ncbi:MAG: hypothetical protein E3J72_00810, partial [Planctomycetota bacterium]
MKSRMMRGTLVLVAVVAAALIFGGGCFKKDKKKKPIPILPGTGTGTSTSTATAPEQVGNPSPADGATGVALTVQLSWGNAANTTLYRVYFGTASPGSIQGLQNGTTFDPGLLSADTMYYWRIDTLNADDTTLGNIWTFRTGTPPAQATGPTPSNGATGVALDQQLSWTGSGDTDGYSVYFGTTSPGTFMGNQTGTTFNPGALDAGTTYYWQIDPYNTFGTTTSAVWTFTTVAVAPFQASNPTPADGAPNIPYNQQLSWDTAAGADWYIVYFGTSSPGALQGYQSATTFDPGGLSTGQDYYWRIDTLNDYGCTAGTVWSFTAGSAPPPATGPNPSNGASGISLTPTLSWSNGGAVTDSFDIYFGDNAAALAFQANQAGTSYGPLSALSLGTSYYWRIDTLNSLGYGTTTSAVWTFVTGGVSLTPDLLVWAKKAGGGGDDWGRSISTLSDGSAIVTGSFTLVATFGNASEGNETILSSAGSYDIFIAKYNPDGTLAWAKSAGGSNWDEGYGISTLSDGSAILTGFFKNTCTFGNASEGNETVLSSNINSEIFVAKYNPDGTLAWAKSAGGESSDIGQSIAALSDGSAIVTGYFRDTATFGNASEGNETILSSAGIADIFIAKYNPDGTLAWAESVGGESVDYGSGISALPDGSALVTGAFQNTATFGVGEGNETDLTSAGDYDIFIAKYNPDGTLAWAKRAGGGNYDTGHDISALSDGSAVVTGFFSTTATFGNASEGNETVLSSTGSFDIFIAKYNPDGTLNWAKSAGGT